MIRSWALILLLAGLLPNLAMAAANRQAELEQLRTRMATLSGSIEKEQSRQDALARDLQATERRITTAQAEMTSLEQQATAQRQRIHTTEKEIVDARRTLAQRNDGLRQQLRAAYVIGRQGQTQLLLNQSDVQKVGRVLVYYDYLQRAQTGAIESIRGRVNELEALAERLQGEIARLSELKTQQEATLAQLRDSRSERANTLSKVRARIADERSELKRLQADERSINELIQRVQRAAAEVPAARGTFSNQPFSRLRGKLPWPARGKLIASYGQAKAGGKLNWRGHWISAKEGSPVQAVARGRVVYVGWMHRYGLIVLVEHDNSYYSLYGHSQTSAVQVGDAVNAGQVVARAGTTGGHEQSGVYFELRKGTQAIDPRQWLVR